jgi:hypothetical protein
MIETSSHYFVMLNCVGVCCGYDLWGLIIEVGARYGVQCPRVLVRVLDALQLCRQGISCEPHGAAGT